MQECPLCLTDSGGGSSSAGAIAGGIIAAIIVIVLVIVVVVLIYYIRRLVGVKPALTVYMYTLILHQELIPYESMQHVVMRIIIVAKWLCTCLACMCVYHSSQLLLPCMMINLSFCHTRRRGDSVKSSYVPAPAARETTAITAGRDPIRYTKPAEEINMEKIIGELYLNRSK